MSLSEQKKDVSGGRNWSLHGGFRKWLDLPIRSKGIVVISIPLVSILFSVIALHIFQRQRMELNHWIERAFQAGSRIQSVVTLLVDADNGVRGFRLTQDPAYLEPYQRAEKNLSTRLAGLRKALADSPSQLERIDQVESLSREWLVTLEGALRPVESSDVKDRLAEGRSLMNSIQQKFTAMRAEESELWVRRIAAETSLRTRLSYAMYASASISLLAGGFSMFLFVMGIATRLQLLRENAGRLVRREPMMSLPPGADEIGQLGEAVALSGRLLSGREAELRQINNALDHRVQERTLQLERQEQQLHAQLQRLKLLGQIVHAIAERQDMRSVFQVVVRSLEDNLPIDFACVCLYDPASCALTVTCAGVRNEALAMELAMTEQARISVDKNGLTRCLNGELVYEPDTSQVEFPFPRRFSSAGLQAVVAAPLLSESGVLGILVAARRQPNSFTSGDCEFLLQLSQHVAVAARQAELYDALQRAYDELRQTQQAVMQQERLRALGQMASGIAHDINNALSPAALYTETLLEREPNLSARTREYLEMMRRSIGDVAHTVGRMKEFYRQRESQLVLMPVDINRLVQEVLDLSRARWSDMPQQRGIVIQLRTELAPELPAMAGIESEVREALVNLVFNAVDAMPEGGTLVLRTKMALNGPGMEAPQSVHVEVEDTGLGMDEETRRRCLEPFFTTKGERGTGLGLAMVYGVAQRLNAEIDIESTVGSGTTVRLSFPVAAIIANPIQHAVTAAPSHLRILVVDDDPLIIKSLLDALQADGHIVTAAHGGQEGIDIWRAAEGGNEPFAVVITDLGMPYVDGRKVASAVKTMNPVTPVILLTGWGQRMEVQQSVPEHIDRVLSKPPKLHDLRTALSELATSVNSTIPVSAAKF